MLITCDITLITLDISLITCDIASCKPCASPGEPGGDGDVQSCAGSATKDPPRRRVRQVCSVGEGLLSPSQDREHAGENNFWDCSN